MTAAAPPIPPDDLPRFVGRLVHVVWARAACNWRLVALLPDGQAVIETPKTKRRLVVPVSDLRLTRRHETRTA